MINNSNKPTERKSMRVILGGVLWSVSFGGRVEAWETCEDGGQVYTSDLHRNPRVGEKSYGGTLSHEDRIEVLEELEDMRWDKEVLACLAHYLGVSHCSCRYLRGEKREKIDETIYTFNTALEEWFNDDYFTLDRFADGKKIRQALKEFIDDHVDDLHRRLREEKEKRQADLKAASTAHMEQYEKIVDLTFENNSLRSEMEGLREAAKFDQACIKFEEAENADLRRELRLAVEWNERHFPAPATD